MKRSGILFCLCGPAGVGKSHLAQMLIGGAQGTLTRSISVTTRPPRGDEKEGSSYFFVSRAEFEKRACGGEFFEWEEVHGNLYGSPRKALTEAMLSGKDLLLVIDIKGCLRIKEQLPENTVIVFVVPPSFTELQRRLEKRGDTDSADLLIRLKTARDEFGRLLDSATSRSPIDYIVINDSVEHAIAALRSVLDAERARLSRLSPVALEQLLRMQ